MLVFYCIIGFIVIWGGNLLIWRYLCRLDGKIHWSNDDKEKVATGVVLAPIAILIGLACLGMLFITAPPKPKQSSEKPEGFGEL